MIHGARSQLLYLAWTCEGFNSRLRHEAMKPCRNEWCHQEQSEGSTPWLRSYSR